MPDKMDNLNKWLTLIANIAVVAGIVFLAIEVRQNSEVVRINSFQTLTTEISDWQRMAAQPVFAQLWSDLNEVGYENLNPNQKWQYWGMINSYLMIQQNSFYQFSKGHFDTDLWPARERSLVRIFQTDGGVKHWERESGLFGDDFRSYINSIIIPMANNNTSWSESNAR